MITYTYMYRHTITTNGLHKFSRGHNTYHYNRRKMYQGVMSSFCYASSRLRLYLWGKNYILYTFL